MDKSILEIKRSISSKESTSGSFLDVLGDSIRFSGLSFMYFSNIKNSKKLLKPEIILDCEVEFSSLEISCKNPLISSEFTSKGFLV